MKRLWAVSLAICLAGPVAAQDETLADIRQELTLLFGEVQRLQREMSTTGAVQGGLSGDVLTRVDLIEAELQRLTAKTEELEFRITQVVRDGTNRVGDLEFRLCELEAECDIADLGDTPMLGGETPVAVTPPSPESPPAAPGAELAVGEQADFDRAQTALTEGRFADAAALFEAFVRTYPGSPLTVDALFFGARAQEELGSIGVAARGYLNTFSAAPNGERAPDALFRLGRALGALNQINEACATLSEVSLRFPGGAAAGDASAEFQRLGCT